MQNSVFRFLTKEINLDNLFVLEFFDIGLTNFESIYEVFGELTAVNCIALLDQWLSLDAWEDHSQEITRIYAFSKAVNYIMDNPHYKRKNQPDKLPDIQFHRNSVKRQIKFQLHNAQQELIMTHDSFIRQPMKWHRPDSYTKALPPDSKPGPADAYSHNNTSLPSILKSHSRNTQHFALGGGKNISFPSFPDRQGSSISSSDPIGGPDYRAQKQNIGHPKQPFDSSVGTIAVSYTHLTLPTTPYV